MNFNIDFKTIKELIMKYGFFKVSFTLTACALVLIVAWQFANIVQAIAVLIGALK